MTEHKVKEQSPARAIQVNNSYQVTLTCTCGRRFSGRGRTDRRAVQAAETSFREHIPIR